MLTNSLLFKKYTSSKWIKVSIITRKYHANNSLKSAESFETSDMETGTERFQRFWTWMNERIVIKITEKLTWKSRFEEQHGKFGATWRTFSLEPGGSANFDYILTKRHRERQALACSSENTAWLQGSEHWKEGSIVLTFWYLLFWDVLGIAPPWG